MRGWVMKLNIGSGTEQLEGYKTIDIDPTFQPDYLHDLNFTPWPIESNSVFQVRAFHILEHLDNPLEIAKEVHRILVPGGIFTIELPHEKSPDATRDWSHKHTRWNRQKMKWLESPTNYVNGINFMLLQLSIESPWKKLMKFKTYREWWNWKNLFRYGNIRATYIKILRVML